MAGGSSDQTMTCEQRVLAALAGRQPDRVPILAYVNPYHNDWYSYLPSFAEVLPAIERYCDVVYEWRFPSPLMFTAGERWIEQRDLGNDQTEQVIHTPDGPITEVVHGTWRDRRVVKRWIQTTQDVDRALSIPYVPAKPDLAAFRATRAALANRAVAQATFPEPMALADWVDDRSLAKWCARDRGPIRNLLDVAYDRIAANVRACLRADIGPIFALRAGHSMGLAHLSDTDFREFVVDYDRRLVQLTRRHEGTYVILEGGGRGPSTIEALSAIGMNGLTIGEPPQRDECDLATVKDRLGDRVCLISTLAYDELTSGSPIRTEQAVRQVLRTGAPGGRFILSPCGMSHRGDLTDQGVGNLIRYLRVARAFGRYPLRD